MSLFDLIKYSPLSVSEEMCQQLPRDLCQQWFVHCYDAHLVMLEIEDTKNTSFRDDANMISKAERKWFIESLKLKKTEQEAIRLLALLLVSQP